MHRCGFTFSVAREYFPSCLVYLLSLCFEVDTATLRRSVAEATETRKNENAEATAVAAQNNAAVQLLGVAENRLNKSPQAVTHSILLQSDGPVANPLGGPVEMRSRDCAVW